MSSFLGKAIYPTNTAKSGMIPTKFDKPPNSPEEDFYFCKQCGFPCKESRTSLGETADGNGGVVVIAGDPTVTSGCPFCGSLNWK